MEDKSNHLSLRKVIDTDESILFNWANDPDVRKWSFNQNIITLNEHRTWFNEKLKDSRCSMYLIFCGCTPIGQVRFDDEGDFARIDYSIERQYRGRKLGKRILDMAIKKYQTYSEKILLGEVFPENFASAKIFEALGFSMEMNRGNIIYTKV